MSDETTYERDIMKKAVFGFLAGAIALITLALSSPAANAQTELLLHYQTPRGLIYVENHTTDSIFHAHDSFLQWQNAFRGTLGHPVWGACHTGFACIKIVQGYYGPTGWAALTAYSYNQTTHAFLGTTTIKFNLSYRPIDYHDGAQESCHELGHAYGITWHSNTGSCLYWQVSSRAYDKPGYMGEWVHFAYTHYKIF